jgi:CRP-like cAMP-binding protein
LVIFNHGSLVQLNSNQVLYKEGAGDCLAYVILCGKLVVYTHGDALCVIGAGESVGEEAFMSSQWNYRRESCVSDGVSYLLAIDGNSIEKIEEQLVIYGYQHDYLALMKLFEDSFRRKQRRRKLLSTY